MESKLVHITYNFRSFFFSPFHLRMLVKSLDFVIRWTWAYILSLAVKSWETLYYLGGCFQHRFGLQPYLSLFLLMCHSIVIWTVATGDAPPRAKVLSQFHHLEVMTMQKMLDFLYVLIFLSVKWE